MLVPPLALHWNWGGSVARPLLRGSAGCQSQPSMSVVDPGVVGPHRRAADPAHGSAGWSWHELEVCVHAAVDCQWVSLFTSAPSLWLCGARCWSLIAVCEWRKGQLFSRSCCERAVLCFRLVILGALIMWIVFSIKTYRSGNAKDCILMSLLYLTFLLVS